jgi:DNA-binding NtrC family response regulator
MPIINFAADDADVRVLLGSSHPMRELAEQVHAVARSGRAALLIGETGVGKSRVARSIHALSARATASFRDVDCGLRPQGLLGMQLFGAELRVDAPGVLGVFESSEGGTVYLDEVAGLPPDLQLPIVQLLEESTICRTGGEKRVGVDVRVIASSTKDLATEVTEERFNEELYYLLGIVPLHLPPLRARAPEDLRETTMALIAELRRGLTDAPREISDRTLDLMMRYPWPGNVRELRNVLEYALLHARGASSVDLMHLPAEVLEASPGVAHSHVSRTLAEVERTHIERTLRAHGANRTRAARELGISRATLIKKIREYGLSERQLPGLARTQESA